MDALARGSNAEHLLTAMRHYIVKITSHEYGTREKEYRIEASGPGIAANRAFGKAKKEKVLGKRRLSEWHIKITQL